MTKTMWTTLSALLIAVPATAATPLAAVNARHGNFKQIGKAFKAISDEVKRPGADLAVIRANAAALDTLSGKLPAWFPRGTGPQRGIKTEASPAIWQKPADFRTAATRFRNASRNLKAASAAGDLAKLSAATGAVGATCKGCHESFRIKD